MYDGFIPRPYLTQVIASFPTIAASSIANTEIGGNGLETAESSRMPRNKRQLHINLAQTTTAKKCIYSSVSNSISISCFSMCPKVHLGGGVQVENAETEVQKQTYKSKKKKRLLVSSVLLTHDCVCWGPVRSQKWLSPSDLRARSLGLWCHGEVTVQTQPKTSGECGLYVPNGLMTVIQMWVLS